MIASAVITNFILGALWRRWLGMEGTGPRWVKIAAGALLSWPAWLVLPWWLAAVLTPLCILFFIWKVDSAKPWPRLFVFGIGYTLAYRYWRDEWNRPPFIDGATAIGEMFLGATTWTAFGAVVIGAASLAGFALKIWG